MCWSRPSLLQAKGFTVFTTHDEGMLGKTDQDQLEHAVELQSAFLTHNRVDFEKLDVQYITSKKEKRIME